MNRKKLIIFSITGIVIILLALLGYTYGYYVTKISGNTNRNSIYVTSTTLALEYAEDENSNIELDSIEPGVMSSKTFTVKNVGNEIVEDYGIYLEEVINTFSRTEDLNITLTCKEYDASNFYIGNCNGIETDYPITNTRLVTNSIDVNYTHEYTFTFEYEYLDDIDQSEDKGKTLSGLIQVYNEPDVIDITGTVAGYTSGDYIELTKDGKISQIISDNTYRITAVGVGQHTINLKSADGTIKASKTIKLMKDVSEGAKASISEDGTNIKFVKDTYEAIVNIEVSGSNMNTSGENVTVNKTNPFNETSLAYQIYQNKAQIQRYVVDSGLTYTVNGIGFNKNVKELTTVTGIADGTNIEDNGLFKAEDDYGTSYIYRGTVINNYVDFAGFTWRIVRINGDGTVRLILDGRLDDICVEYHSNGVTCLTRAGDNSVFNINDDDNAFVGYTYGKIGISAGDGTKTAYDLTHEYTGDKTNENDKTGQSDIKQAVDTFYKTFLLEDYNDYISDTLFCGDKSLASNSSTKGYGRENTEYASHERLDKSIAEPDLRCVYNNTTLTEEQKSYSRYTVSGNSIKGIKTNNNLIYPIALLSSDELVMAGATTSKRNKTFYLINDKTVSSFWWTMTPKGHDATKSINYVSGITTDSLFSANVENITGVRPVINLSYTNALYGGGDGTENNPYTIKPI